MTLIIQIAAGIVLGFAIIAYRGPLLKSAKWIAAIVSLVIFIGVVGWIGTEAVGAAQPYLGKFFSKIGIILGGILAIVFGILGGLSLLELLCTLGWRKRKPSRAGSFAESENMIFAASLANVLLVYVVTWPILYFTPIGTAYKAFDQWSRNSGFADGGALIVSAICWLWPVLPLWFLARRTGNKSQTNEIENPNCDVGN
jgi:hypothetical protein